MVSGQWSVAVGRERGKSDQWSVLATVDNISGDCNWKKYYIREVIFTTLYIHFYEAKNQPLVYGLSMLY